MSAVNRCKATVIANVLALGLIVAYLASLCIPASEATRIRNAMLLEIAQQSDIDWTPASVPASFRAETRSPSAAYARIVSLLGVSALPGDWDRALVLAGHLTQNAKDMGAVQADLETTYRSIVEEGRGYCADFTEVYLALAHAAGLFAREWGFSFDGFGGHGHAFIEIYDRQRGRWLWLDVFNNVHAVDAATQEPLSASEFRAYVRGERAPAVVKRNGPGRLGYKYTGKLLDYYRRGAAEWYLWGGNAVFSYEAHPLVRAGGVIAVPVEQMMAILVDVHPRIRVLPTHENIAQLARMAQLRKTLAALALVFTVLLAALVWQLIRLRQLHAQSDSEGYRDASSLATR